MYKNTVLITRKQNEGHFIWNRDLNFCTGVVTLASHAGVFRGARFSSLPTKTSSPKNAYVGGYYNFGVKSIENTQLNSVGVTDKLERNVSKMTIKTFSHETVSSVYSLDC